ncbi:MAG: homocysteine S-methyltransferase family protein, partial [Ilumatobacteraceae bacterium]
GHDDILVTLLEMDGAPFPLVSKGNCGVPQFVGTEIVYSGTPELMARYAALAVDAGARIVGGCCGTSPEHLASMRAAIDAATPGVRPTVATIVEQVGPLTNSAPTENAERRGRRSRA